MATHTEAASIQSAIRAPKPTDRLALRQTHPQQMGLCLSLRSGNPFLVYGDRMSLQSAHRSDNAQFWPCLGKPEKRCQMETRTLDPHSFGERPQQSYCLEHQQPQETANSTVIIFVLGFPRYQKYSVLISRTWDCSSSVSGSFFVFGI